jgi:predicted nucleic acid-binding protein
MIFADLPAGSSIFLDANTFIYHFTAHSLFGPPCTQLLQGIRQHQLAGFTSTHVLSVGRASTHDYRSQRTI